MLRPGRVGRALVAGSLLGLLLSFGYVSVAQTVRGESMPLVTALQSAALAADVQLVVAGVPVGDVFLPAVADDWRSVLEGLAAAFGLHVCDLGPSTLLVTDSEEAGRLCAPVIEELGEAAVEIVEEPEAVSAELVPVVELVAPVVSSDLVYRVRVLQLDETRAVDLGLDWSGGVFETAARLLAGGYAVSRGIFPVEEMGSLVRFLESEGVAMRLEDVELRSYGGVPVRFNRGGTIAVNLVGGGAAAIVERYQYGLGLDLEGVEADGVVELRYQFTDSAPSNVSDPSNVQISSTTSASVVRVPCGHSVVLAAIGSAREGSQGAGLPVLAAVPGVGYAFGTGGVVQGRTTFVVTVDVGCAG